MTNPVTTQELIDASLDCATLETVVNGSATPGTLTSRLGTSLKTLSKIVADLSAQDIGTGAAALINARIDTIDAEQDVQDAAIASLQLQLNLIKAAIGYDAAAQAFFTATGITDPTIKQAVNDLVLGLKYYGIWDRCVAVYPFVGGTAATHKYNLYNAADTDLAKRINFLGTWTHDSTGALPNGTTGYADTFINPNEDLPAYSFTASIYTPTSATPSGDRNIYGIVGGSNANLQMQFTSGQYVYVANGADAAATFMQISGQSNFAGLWTATCNGTTFSKLYKNATEMASNSTARSNYHPDLDIARRRSIYLGALNDGTASGKSNYKYQFALFGCGIDATMVAGLSQVVSNFKTALGR